MPYKGWPTFEAYKKNSRECKHMYHLLQLGCKQPCVRRYSLPLSRDLVATTGGAPASGQMLPATSQYKTWKTSTASDTLSTVILRAQRIVTVSPEFLLD